MTTQFRDDVCLVIDMDGLHLLAPRCFQCRELGYCSWSGDAGRVAFQPIKPLSTLNRLERLSWRKGKQDIHALPYYPVSDMEEIALTPQHFVKQLY